MDTASLEWISIGYEIISHAISDTDVGEWQKGVRGNDSAARKVLFGGERSALG